MADLQGSHDAASQTLQAQLAAAQEKHENECRLLEARLSAVQGWVRVRVCVCVCVCEGMRLCVSLFDVWLRT
jgi:hypothetical protein